MNVYFLQITHRISPLFLARVYQAFVLLVGLTLVSTAGQAQNAYAISGAGFLKNGIPVTFRGASALHMYGGDAASRQGMNGWQLDIVREFIGSMRDHPIAGQSPVQVDSTWVRPLEQLVRDNRAAGKVTIFCPFYWDGTQATEFVGKNPSQTAFWEDYKTKYRAIATFFAGQSDVWLEVWNEPYSWNRSQGYSDNLWLSDMQQMVVLYPTKKMRA